jgi:hypothetical protein
MKIRQELLITFVVCLVIYLYRNLFISIYKNSILGRLIFILFIIFSTLKKKEFGVLAVILYVIIDKTIIEGMTTNDSTNDSDNNANNGDGEISNDTKCCPCDSSKNESTTTNEINDAIASFKTKHCKNGKVIDKNGNPIDMKDLASNFPEISFNLEKCATCNPCAEGCNFKLTSGSERITLEENLRPVDSAVISTN